MGASIQSLCLCNIFLYYLLNLRFGFALCFSWVQGIIIVLLSLYRRTIHREPKVGVKYSKFAHLLMKLWISDTIPSSFSLKSFNLPSP
jgi:hypothetical protein